MTQTPGPDLEAVREARTFFRAGVASLPLLTILFVVGFELSLPDSVFVAFVMGTLPLVTIAQLPLLEFSPIERKSAYTSSAAMLAILGTVATVLGGLGPGLEALGLSLTFGRDEWLWTGVAVVGVSAVGLVSHQAGRTLGLDETPLMKDLIPRTSDEKLLFAGLSVAAGVFEEIVYRGYMVVVLGTIFSGVWWAAIVSSLAFAVLHAYQGPAGIIRSGVLGFVFAAVFILGGSLWPLIIVHTGVDLVSGIWLGPRMIEREESGA